MMQTCVHYMSKELDMQLAMRIRWRENLTKNKRNLIIRNTIKIGKLRNYKKTNIKSKKYHCLLDNNKNCRAEETPKGNLETSTNKTLEIYIKMNVTGELQSFLIIKNKHRSSESCQDLRYVLDKLNGQKKLQCLAHFLLSFNELAFIFVFQDVTLYHVFSNCTK